MTGMVGWHAKQYCEMRFGLPTLPTIAFVASQRLYTGVISSRK